MVGLPLQPDDEVLEDLPEEEKAADPLRYAKILRSCMLPGGGSRTFAGEVVEIEVGTKTGDRLYRIRYSDGDLQHLTAEEVRRCCHPAAAAAAEAQAPPAKRQKLAAEEENAAELPSPAPLPPPVATSPLVEVDDEPEAAVEAEPEATTEPLAAEDVAEEEGLTYVAVEGEDEDEIGEEAETAPEVAEQPLVIAASQEDLIVLDDAEDEEEDEEGGDVAAVETQEDSVDDAIDMEDETGNSFAGQEHCDNGGEAEEVSIPVVKNRSSAVQKGIVKTAGWATTRTQIRAQAQVKVSDTRQPEVEAEDEEEEAT